MRKAVLFLTAVVFCVMCACQSEKSLTELTESYRKDEIAGIVRAEYGGLSVKAELSVSGNSFEVKVIEPTELSDMRIMRTDGEIRLEYLGMSVPFENAEKLPLAKLVYVFDGLREAEKSLLTVTKTDGKYFVSCDGEYPFTATLDEKGMLLEATYTSRECEIKVIFENMTLKNETV